MWNWLRKALCYHTGHTQLKVCKNGRAYMVCDGCGRQTVGIDLADRVSARRFSKAS